MRFLFFILFLLIGIVSDGQLKIVKDNIACLYGLKNQEGEWVVPAEYTTLEYKGDYFICLKNNFKGIIDKNGIITIDCAYDQIAYCTKRYSKNYYTVFSKGKFGVMRDGNEIVIPIEYKSLGFCQDLTFTFKENDLIGLRDSSRIIINPSFQYINPIITDHSHLITSFKKENKLYVGILNIKGDTVIPFDYEMILATSTNIIFKSNNKYGLMNNKFEWLFPTEYDFNLGKNNKNSIYSNDTFAIGKNGAWGLATGTGKMITELEYKEIDQINYDRYTEYWKVAKGNKYGIIKNNGKIHIPIEFQSIEITSENQGEEYGNYIVTSNSKYGSISFTGKTEYECKYELLNKTNNYYLFRNENELLLYIYEYVYYNNRNHDRWEFRKPYEAINLGDTLFFYSHSDVLYPLYKDKSSNKLIFYQGDWKISPIGFSNHFYLKINNKEYEIDRNGKPYINPLKNLNVSDIGDGYYLLHVKNKKTGVIDGNAEIIVDTIYREIYYLENLGVFWVTKEEYIHSDNDSIRDSRNYQILNLDGKLLIKDYFNKYSSNRTEMVTVFQNKNAGLIDLEKKKIAVKPTYLDIFPFHSLNSIMIGLNMDKSFDLFDKKGNLLSKTHWDKILPLASYVDSEFKTNSNDYSSHCWLLFNKTDTALVNSNGKISHSKKMIKKLLSEIVNTNFDESSINYNALKIGLNYNDTSSINQFKKSIFFNYFQKLNLRELSFTPYNINARHSYSDCYSKNYLKFINDKIETHHKYSNIIYVTFFNSKYLSFRTERMNPAIIPEYGNYVYENDSLRQINIKELFLPGSEIELILNNLLVDEISSNDKINMDCTNITKLYELTKGVYSINEKGISMPVFNYLIQIPWSKLQKYAPEKGIVADFIEASKK